MATLKQIARIRWVMLVAALGLALYYFLVFRPLSDRAEKLDQPLAEVWQDLVSISFAGSGIHDLDLNQIKKTKQRLQDSLTAMEKARQMIAARIEWEPEIRKKLKEPFLQLDFQTRIDEVTAWVKLQPVTLDAAALAGFPEPKAQMKEPNLLWAQLSIVHHILTAAVSNKVGTVKSLSVLPVRTYRTANGGEVDLIEIPVRVELVAPMGAAANFLATLPLRAEEMKSAGLPESRPGKPALFLDRVLLRKQTPEKPDEVGLDVVVCGFVRAMDTQPARPEEKTTPP